MGRGNSLLTFVYLVSGFCGLIYETVWIRKFSLVFGSTLPAMSAVIAIFFLGLALGSWLFGHISVSARNPVRIYALLEFIIALYALAFSPSLTGIEGIYGLLYPSVASHPSLLAFVRLGLACLLLIVPTLLMGGTLPLLSRHFVRHQGEAGSKAGLLYGLNTAGAAFGCFLSGYALFRFVGSTRPSCSQPP